MSYGMGEGGIGPRNEGRVKSDTENPGEREESSEGYGGMTCLRVCGDAELWWTKVVGHGSTRRRSMHGGP
jgi:hypothetical protein